LNAKLIKEYLDTNKCKQGLGRKECGYQKMQKGICIIINLEKCPINIQKLG
jgi:hypothetical protein